VFILLFVFEECIAFCRVSHQASLHFLIQSQRPVRGSIHGDEVKSEVDKAVCKSLFAGFFALSKSIIKRKRIKVFFVRQRNTIFV
jgi:hypothetical protein